MYSNLENPFDTRPPGKPGTTEFLDALGDPQAAKVYREAMGEGDSPSSTDGTTNFFDGRLFLC